MPQAFPPRPRTSGPVAELLELRPRWAGAVAFLRNAGGLGGHPDPPELAPELLGYLPSLRPAPRALARLIRRRAGAAAAAYELRQRPMRLAPPGSILRGYRVFFTVSSEAAGNLRSGSTDVSTPILPREPGLFRVDVFDCEELLDSLPDDGGPEIDSYHAVGRLPRSPRAGGGLEQLFPVTIATNRRFKGLELRFSLKPAEQVRSELRAAGWKWGKFNRCWYKVPTSPGEAEGLLALALEIQRDDVYIIEERLNAAGD